MDWSIREIIRGMMAKLYQITKKTKKNYQLMKRVCKSKLLQTSTGAEWPKELGTNIYLQKSRNWTQNKSESTGNW